MTGAEICKRAAECSPLKYWYGGKGELATFELASRLQRENPSVWTAKYYSKAIKDIDGKNHVGDCSYLVCHAYKSPMISSYDIVEKYPEWNGAPQDGMILWRKGHVGIYEGGRVHELRGIDSDYRFDIYDPSRWSKTLYSYNVTYAEYPLGWNKNMATGQWWYQYGTGSEDFYKSCVAQINGDYYAFYDDGYMVEGSAVIRTDSNGEIVSVERSKP